MAKLKTLIGCRLEDSQRMHLDRWASRLGISRSKAIYTALTTYPDIHGHEKLQGESMEVGGYYEPKLRNALKAVATAESTTVSAIVRARIAALIAEQG
jgi:hypothetical protein